GLDSASVDSSASHTAEIEPFSLAGQGSGGQQFISLLLRERSGTNFARHDRLPFTPPNKGSSRETLPAALRRGSSSALRRMRHVQGSEKRGGPAGLRAPGPRFQ